jgi:hypothetical protein
LAQHVGLNIPTPTLTHQRHGDQFTVAAFRLRPGPFKDKSQLLANIIHHDIHPQAKIVKIVYHGGASGVSWNCFGEHPNTTQEVFLSINLN